MNEPVRKQWTLDELRDKALLFMQTEYGLPERGNEQSKERWRTELGLLTLFASWLWDET
ncbi:MAG: hypothetical protein ACRDHZ_26440 [Ktedonobacteraceae bacterium]